MNGKYRGTVVGLMLLASGAVTACQNSTVPARVSSGVAAAVVALTEAEKLALHYTTLPRCPTQAPICSDQSTVDRIKAADNVAYNAVKKAEANEALLGAALAAVQSFQSIIPK